LEILKAMAACQDGTTCTSSNGGAVTCALSGGATVPAVTNPGDGDQN
jgi:hypothetical protein